MKLMICIFVLSISLLNLVANEKVKNKSSRWGDNQGAMNWFSAKSKCASLSMRLPSKLDLEKAYRDTETETWRKDGNWFWAIEEYSELSAYYFDVETGYPDFTDKTDKMQVRCVR